MTPGARLQTAIDLLTAIGATPRPADAIASAFFRSRRYIGAKDRSAVAEAVYAVLRRHARLHWWLERAGAAPDPRALVIASEAVGEGRWTAVLDSLFSGGRYAPASLTAAEHTLLRALDGHTLEHPAMPEAVRLECPPWAEEPLRRALGPCFAAEMRALQEPAPLDLRVNPIKAEVGAVLAALTQAGITAHPTRWSPFGIRVEGRPAVSALPAFRDGWFEIQDEGSQLVALLCDARPGHAVVDFCSGAGGKALALAAQMNNKGRVVACDVLENRLKRAAERLRRAGLHNVETRVLSSERDPWVKRHKGAFDRVLVDAPCSGTGTWRRNPDARWRPLGPGLAELQALQANILASAVRLVRPGGRLIYATCSLLPEENQDQVARLLADRPDFRLLPAAEVWGALALGAAPAAGHFLPGDFLPGDFLMVTPAGHDTDGFFAAILERGATD